MRVDIFDFLLKYQNTTARPWKNISIKLNYSNATNTFSTVTSKINDFFLCWYKRRQLDRNSSRGKKIIVVNINKFYRVYSVHHRCLRNLFLSLNFINYVTTRLTTFVVLSAEFWFQLIEEKSDSLSNVIAYRMHVIHWNAIYIPKSKHHESFCSLSPKQKKNGLHFKKENETQGKTSFMRSKLVVNRKMAYDFQFKFCHHGHQQRASD